MSNLTDVVEIINQLKPEQVVRHEIVKSHFIRICESLHGNGESIYERESHYFEKIVSDNDNLKKCTPFSFYICFIDLGVCGLSLEPGSKALCYLQPRSFKIGKKPDGSDLYEPRCTLSISGYGELVLRTRAGQIKYADDPVIFYENDHFSAYEKEGRKHVEYICNLPHSGKSIIGCYIRIVRADNSTDYSWLLLEDIERLKGYSAKSNKKWDGHRYVSAPNELYSSQNGGIDSGFLRAKTIKHAFAAYPKVRIGKYTTMEADQEPDYYNFEQQEPEKPIPFGEPANPIAEGVKVDTSTGEIIDDGAF